MNRTEHYRQKTITKSQKRLTLWNFTNIIDYIIKLEIF